MSGLAIRIPDTEAEQIAAVHEAASDIMAAAELITCISDLLTAEEDAREQVSRRGGEIWDGLALLGRVILERADVVESSICAGRLRLVADDSERESELSGKEV